MSDKKIGDLIKQVIIVFVFVFLLINFDFFKNKYVG